MKRIGIIGLAFVAACVLSAGAASSALAGPPLLTLFPYLCLRVDLLGGVPGLYEDSHCQNLLVGGAYVLAKPEHKLNGDLWCARLTEVHKERGLWEDSACEKEKAKSEFLKIEEFPLGIFYVVGQTPLASGQTANVKAKNLGDFTLKPSLGTAPEPLCTGLSSPTTLLGGSPGKSDTEILFTGCTLVGHEKCDVLSLNGTPTNITVPAKDELVYTGTEEEAKNEEGPVGDLFTPAGGGTTFVTLEFLALESAACPGTAVTTAVTGSVIGTVESVNMLTKQGMLTFPKTAITKAWQWLSSGKVDEVKAGLNFAGGTATQVGLADLELESGEEWGVLNQ